MIKYITIGRLRTKYGGTLQDLNIIINTDLTGWHFISKVKDVIAKEIYNRYSMIYINEEI